MSTLNGEESSEDSSEDSSEESSEETCGSRSRYILDLGEEFIYTYFPVSWLQHFYK